MEEGGDTVGARWGHGQYPEDAIPKCIFLTTWRLCEPVKRILTKRTLRPWGASWNYRHSERGNPKSETRNPKQAPSTKQGMTKTTTLLAVLGLGTLGI